MLFFFILLNYMPASLGGWIAIRPAVGMICVFYWVLNRPDLFNMFIVFLLGLVCDVISAIPMGADIVAYLVIYVMLNNFSSLFNNKPFVFVWCGFAFIFIVAILVKWLIVSIFYAEFLPLSQLFFTILFTVACYPIIGIVNDLLRKYLMNDEV